VRINMRMMRMMRVMRVMLEQFNYILRHSELAVLVICCIANLDRIEMMREKGKKVCRLNSRRRNGL
jgi:hypothetical protein